MQIWPYFTKFLFPKKHEIFDRSTFIFDGEEIRNIFEVSNDENYFRKTLKFSTILHFNQFGKILILTLIN